MSQLTDLFTGIANAIRAKSGDSGTIKAANFATSIAELPALKTGTFDPNNEYNQEVTITSAIGLSNIIFLVEESKNYQINGDNVLCGSIVGATAVGCRCYNGGNIYNDVTPSWDSTSGKLNIGTSYYFADRVYRWVAW